MRRLRPQRLGASVAARVSIGLAGLAALLLAAALLLNFLPGRALAVHGARQGGAEAASGAAGAETRSAQEGARAASGAAGAETRRAQEGAGAQGAIPTNAAAPPAQPQMPDDGGMAFLGLAAAGTALLLVAWGLLASGFYLRKASARPDAAWVAAMLDLIPNGVLVLDEKQRIALANRSFAEMAGTAPSSLAACSASSLGWTQACSEDAPDEYPWTKVIRDGETSCSAPLGLRTASGGLRILTVSAAPLLDGGRPRGALVTFEDATSADRQHGRLRQALNELRKVRDEVDRQNRQLEVLATRDPLTGCLNRRSFFEQFDSAWNGAKRYRYSLSCLMVDVDHFKEVNDEHGHRMGDRVLQQVAGVLSSALRGSDLICRYGGEEFCVLLTHTNIDEAWRAAERIRKRVRSCRCSGLTLTVSLGVSATDLGAREPLELIEQADKALYAAKRRGRDHAARWDETPAELLAHEPAATGTKVLREAAIRVPIPFPAVSSLFSAMAYRDIGTARHCRRVADLCVAVARELVPARDCYVLEVAALLHDIGKLGVPDAILHKPGQLTQEEWKVMRAHDRMGTEIVAAAFASAELTAILQAGHAWHGGTPHDPSLPQGDAIPPAARLLSIADAYDAMTTDRVYRKAFSREEAFAELRRCAGSQFDPAMVERLIATVSAGTDARPGAAPPVPREDALRIGREIENLAYALDAQDFVMMAAVGRRLQDPRTCEAVPQIAELAERLESAAASGQDDGHTVRLAAQLLEKCRATQVSCLDEAETYETAGTC